MSLECALIYFCVSVWCECVRVCVCERAVVKRSLPYTRRYRSRKCMHVKRAARTHKCVCAYVKSLLWCIYATHSECDTRWISVLLKLKQCFYFLRIHFQMSTMITRNRSTAVSVQCSALHTQFSQHKLGVSCEWTEHWSHRFTLHFMRCHHKSHSRSPFSS